MNENLKQALDQMSPAEPDPRDHLFRNEHSNNLPKTLPHEVVGSALDPALKTESNMSKERQEEQALKIQKTEALSPKG